MATLKEKILARALLSFMGYTFPRIEKSDVIRRVLEQAKTNRILKLNWKPFCVKMESLFKDWSCEARDAQLWDVE